MTDQDYTPVADMNLSTHNRKRFLPLIVLGIILLAIGAFAFFGSQKTQQPNPNLPTEVAIELTNDGFKPDTVTIKEGGAVRWTNNTSDEQVSVNSDDHPDHKKNPELNLGVIPKESTVVHIFSTPGEYTYHDHFHPERTGKVIVQ